MCIRDRPTHSSIARRTAARKTSKSHRPVGRRNRRTAETRSAAEFVAALSSSVLLLGGAHLRSRCIGHCLKTHVDTARLPLRTRSESANDGLTNDLRKDKLLSVCDSQSQTCVTRRIGQRIAAAEAQVSFAAA